MIRAVVKREAVHEAHNLLGVIRRLFTWAISCGAYGIDNSPCDRLKPRDVIGVGKTARQRVLTDVELRALWNSDGPRTHELSVRADVSVAHGDRPAQRRGCRGKME